MLAALHQVPVSVAPARRLTQLVAGLWLYGASMALQIRATLGLDPWDVLHEGLTKRTGLSFGVVTILVGALVLLCWAPLRQRPGVGTVCNVLLIGVAVDVTLAVLPAPAELLPRTLFLVAGIVLNGLAAAVYIGARLGPGPRDGLTTGFCARTGASLRLVRTAVELAVLAVGWSLGGTIGVGTVLYALAIGPLTQAFLPLVTWSSRPAA
ncbi:YczE/YyaS/YitT family protein [Saccharothrix australiensis]|uniref:Putative membrane protein YczE n=1 Tax=Saccharothrix australiensis TaxID=2072 RepID=A0A495W9Y6_9PSEU|nr:putative membrane protein YczE [Saccharothrix australiensis]